MSEVILKPAYSIEELVKSRVHSRSTIYEALNSGRLKARKINGRTIVLGTDYAAYLESLPLYPTKDANHDTEGGE